MASKDFDLLSELQAQRSATQAVPSGRTVAPSVASTIPLDQDDPRPRIRRIRPDLYTLIIGKGALIIILGLILYAWYWGGRFTLIAFDDWGIHTASWGILAWTIPIAITMIEMGVWSIRARSPLVWVVWAGVLFIDSLTTAIGLLAFTHGPPLPSVTQLLIGPWGTNVQLLTWFVAMAVGVGLAVGPEPGAKNVLKEIRA
jgi:hypothetical protein